MTGNDARILVLGATSEYSETPYPVHQAVLTVCSDRPTDIDAAFLRRMPKRFAIRLPDAAQRKSILKLVRIAPASMHVDHTLTPFALVACRCFEISLLTRHSILTKSSDGQMDCLAPT